MGVDAMAVDAGNLELLARDYMDLELSAAQMRIDTRRYYERAFMEAEEQAIWRRCWQAACREDDVPNPGDYFEYRVGSQSYVITRDKAGQVHAFHNACRHRGNLLCKGSGNARSLTCPYHLWQFAHDGRLLHASDPETFVDFNPAEYSLKRVSVGTRLGFVFINPDPDAGPLEEYLAPLADFADRFSVADMVPVNLNTSQRIRCNWKIVIEAFSESYHVQGVHPQNLPMSNDIDRRFAFFGDHRLFVAPFGEASPRLGEVPVEEVVDAFGVMAQAFLGPDAPNPVATLVEPWRQGDGSVELPDGVTLRSLSQGAMRKQGQAEGLDYSRLTDAQLTDVTHISLFPNIALVMRGGELNYFRARPDPEGDPEWCVIDAAGFRLIADPEARAKARVPFTEVPTGTSMGYVIDQDIDIMPRQQLGLRSAGLDHIVLSRQEVGIMHFHQIIDQKIAALASAEAR